MSHRPTELTKTDELGRRCVTRQQVADVWQARSNREWASLTEVEQDFIYNSWVDYKFFLRHVYFPHELHGMWTEENHQRTRLYGFQETLAYICQYELPRYGKVTIEAPTGSSKTDTVAKGYPIWRAAKNRRIRIGLYGHDASKTERHMSKFQSHFQSNWALVECFGAFWDEKHEKDFRWGQEVIQVRGCGGNETIRAASLGGESEGYPFDLIVCDDVQGAKEATTPEQKEKAWRWFTEVVEYRLRADTDDPEDGCIVSIGTRQNPGDIHARLRETDDWKWFCFPAVLKWAVVKDRTLGENGEYELVERDGRIVPVELWENYLEPPVVLVPERRGFTYAELCRERDTKPVQFARKRQNLVRDESAKLFGQAMLSAYCRADGGTDPEGRRKPLLRAWDWHEGKPEEYPVNIHRILIGVDLAATAKTKGRYDPDYTVFAVLGLTDNGVRVLLDVIRFRTGNPKVQRERLLRAVQAYEPSVPPIVEANACQRLWARDAIEQLGIALRMDELKASKLDEIESFADLAYAGKFWYPWDIRDPHTLNIMRAFENELTAYPETRHDDQLMALILAERHVRKGGEVEFSPVVRASAKRLSIVGRDLDDGEKAEMQRAWFEGEEPDGSVGQRIVRRKERRGRRACVPAARWAAA